MNGLRIYIEGGGDRQRQRGILRTGFQSFLSPLRDEARKYGYRWDIILCGGRQSAYDDYLTALRKHPDMLNILLVDAESPVAGPPWQHLQARDGWSNPGVGDHCCHLMVQVVEAWLVADPDALADCYGQGFNRNALALNPDVESIPKADLLMALERASRHTQKKTYRKIQHCADLLARVSATTVRQRARHCERLFSTLAGIIRES